ncbi:MAG: rhomboid family intramembrane serine protease [Candidatus Kapaibacteriales bacterium]
MKSTWYEFITHGLIHGGMGHLFFNMLTLFFFGPRLEMTIGGLPYLTIYVVCMVIASLPDYLRKSDDPNYRSLGASGAIAGILFSSILFYPESNLYLMFLPIPIPGPIFGLLYLAYSYFGERYGQDNIGHTAHLWGALCGIVLTFVIWPEVIDILGLWLKGLLS